MLKKVISGGQTGVDQLGLFWAKENEIPTGGTAPKYFMTEKGSQPSLADLYQLIECETNGYPARTIENVKNSDGTILFGNPHSPGYKLTASTCSAYKRPCLENPSCAEEFVHFVRAYRIRILNIAGTRGSNLSDEDANRYSSIINEAFHELNPKLI